MTVVSNTGPLIALAKINQLPLLKKLFSTVSIPPAVHRELLAKTGSEVSYLDEALSQFVSVSSTPDTQDEVKIATTHLGIGEQQAIALAYENRSLLIIDERLGRSAARQLGLTISGTAGVLVVAKERGFIPVVRSFLDDIRRHGYWLSDDLLAYATQLAGESQE